MLQIKFNATNLKKIKYTINPFKFLLVYKIFTVCNFKHEITIYI